MSDNASSEFASPLLYGAGFGLLAVIVSVGLHFASGVQSDAAEQPAEQADQIATVANDVAERRAADRAKGFHCLSAWDGSHTGLVDQVKSGLRNPSSFEHDSTEVGPLLRTNNRPIKMVYRAENGFGGMNVETVWGAMDQDSCAVTVITDPSKIDELLPTD